MAWQWESYQIYISPEEQDAVFKDDKSKKYGIGNRKINAAVYNEVIPMGSSMYYVNKNGKQGYIDCKGSEYFED